MQQLLTEEEREELKKLHNEGYKYLARDEDSELYAYSSKPVRELLGWASEGYCDWVSDCRYLDYKFINWEDDEPYEIEKLLEGEK